MLAGSTKPDNSHQRKEVSCQIIMGKQSPVNREHLEHWADALENHGSKLERKGRGYMANCPAHDDKTPSLSIQPGDTVEVVVSCYAGCTFDAIRAALDFGHAPITPAPRRPATPEPPPKKPQHLPDGPHHTIYQYVSADGEAVMAVDPA